MRLVTRTGRLASASPAVEAGSTSHRPLVVQFEENMRLLVPAWHAHVCSIRIACQFYMYGVCFGLFGLFDCVCVCVGGVGGGEQHWSCSSGLSSQPLGCEFDPSLGSAVETLSKFLYLYCFSVPSCKIGTWPWLGWQKALTLIVP